MQKDCFMHLPGDPFSVSSLPVKDSRPPSLASNIKFYSLLFIARHGKTLAMVHVSVILKHI